MTMAMKIKTKPIKPTVGKNKPLFKTNMNELKGQAKERSLFFYFLISLLLLGFIFSMTPQDPTPEEPFSRVASLIKEGQVEEIMVTGDQLQIKLKDGSSIKSRRDSVEGLTETFNNLGVDIGGVKIIYDDPAKNSFVKDVLLTFGPVLLIIVLFSIIFRSAGRGGADVFSFGKSRARMFNKDNPQVKFANVGGADEAKHELEEVVDFLRNPGKYRKLGARIPKGVLLVGPAGTGKTLLARAIAGEAEVPFFSIAGSEFMEMLVGVGASRVRDLFKNAKENAPALIFIDEVESIGRQRGYGVGGGHDEREQTLNQILVEMDGFEPNTNVIVLAATNRPDLLDPALIRAGRFDRRVMVGLPDIEGRTQIIGIHMKGKPFHQDVSAEAIARRTVGFSGADLENMLNEAAILAASGGKKEIDRHDIDEAATKVKLGPEKKRMQSDEARKLTACHEAGHAVVMHLLPTTDPVHTVSIISRGMALGFTLAPPSVDRYNETKERLEDMITSYMGGRVAEEMVCGEQSVGASDDLDKATEIAKAMVTEYGMSSLGPISFKSYNEEGMYGYLVSGPSNKISEELMAKVDSEISQILHQAYDKAKKLLKGNTATLDQVIAYLLQHETLDADEFEKIMGGEKKVKGGVPRSEGVVIAPEAHPQKDKRVAPSAGGQRTEEQV